MKKVTLRQARVGDLLRETIAELIMRRVKDPRIEGVTITDVDISMDLRDANVYFCVYDSNRVDDAMNGLKSAEGFLRHELKKTLRIKTIPMLNFKYDSSLDYGTHMDAVLDDLKNDEHDN